MTLQQMWKTQVGTLEKSTLIQAPAGAGKTQLIIHQAVEYLNSGANPEGLLVLAPTRLAGERIRSAIYQESTATVATPPVRTWSAYAFHLISRAFEAGLTMLEGVKPQLLTGADQDAVINTLLKYPEVLAWAWPQELGKAIQTKGFRKEVREFFDRMQEYQLDEQSLNALIIDNPDTPAVWPLLGKLFTMYNQILRLDLVGRFDPAGLIGTAITILQRGKNSNTVEKPTEQDQKFEQFYLQERGRLEMLLIDDLQEANPAMHQLLALIGNSKAVLGVANADTVVQGFRGATPHLLNELTDSTINWEQRLTYNGSAVLSGGIARTYQHVTNRIGTSGQATHARLQSFNEGTGEVEVALAASEAEQNLLILSYVLQWLKGNRDDAKAPVELNEQAIIVRNSKQVKRIADFMRAEGIAVRTNIADVILAEEPVVMALLDVLTLAMSMVEEDPTQLNFDQLTAGVIEHLLKGQYIGMNNLQVRSMRKQLLRNTAAPESTEGMLQELDPTTFIGTARERLTSLTCSAILAEYSDSELGADGALPPKILQAYQNWSVFEPLRRLVKVLVRTIHSLNNPEDQAEDTLWELWDATGVAPEWRERSKKAGAEGLQANRDLDAIVTLFQVAQRFQDQNPAASAEQFLQHLSALELPTDSLSKTIQQTQGLSILTPASAAGLNYSNVIVAGLQLGSWPNEQPRGTLLGSVELVEVIHGLPHSGSEAQMARRHGTHNDELRTFATAISRARHTLVALAVAAEDQQPSSFLKLVEASTPEISVEVAVEPVALTPHQLIGQLRRELRLSIQEGNTAPQELLALLSFLANQPDEELEPAQPQHWWGIRDRSTQAPLYEKGEPFRLSPSRIETLLSNPLDWLLSEMGSAVAAQESDLFRHVGVLVHYLAERFPDGDEEALAAELDSFLPQLNLSGMFGQHMEARLREMVKSLSIYLKSARVAAGVEVPFKHTVDTEWGELTISGIIDRIEQETNGQARIVDFKTGKQVISKAAAQEHMQLAIYQLAYLAGSVDLEESTQGSASAKEVSGAALIYVGAGKNSVSEMTREQDSSSKTEMTEKTEKDIKIAADVIHQEHFLAVENGFGNDRIDGFNPTNSSNDQVTRR